MATLIMPQLGESVTEGTIVQWLKQPGDTVALDEPLVEVDTEKVNVEIPSPYAGTLSAILVSEGDTVPVGTPLAEIATADEPTAVAPHPPPPPRAAVVTETPRPASAPAAPVTAVPEGKPSADGKRRYSPAVRRLSAEHNIDPAALTGTGAGGRVTRKDVLAALEARAAAPAAPTLIPPAAAPAAPPLTEDTVVTFTPIRRRIAQNMVQSRFTAPHAWLLMETDVTGLVRLRTQVKDEFQRREGADLTYMAFVAQAVSQALHAFPTINATWAGDDLIQRRSLNLGIAVDTEEGLIVPVVKDADHMNVAALAVAIADVAQRARRRKLKLDEVQGGTFTIDNTGVFGSVASGPIINYPQVAILTTEAVVKRPVVVDNDAIAIRSMMNLTLSFDHRAMDGSTAAGFTAHVRDSLQAIGPTTAIY